MILMMENDVFILQLSLNHWFKEINKENKVINSDNSIDAMLFDNIYTVNSFKTLLSKNYNTEYQVIKLT